ncbi:MAG: ArnT family glycosyltransferase [Hydrogenovibrio sp.]
MIPSNSPATLALKALKTPSGASLTLVSLVTLWHLLLAGQLNLSVDEAHYALYGLKPDWSYFDHPPMVGWLNALILPFTHSDFGLRLLPATLFALSNWMLYRLTLRLFPDFQWGGFWTLALVNSAIMFQLLSLSMLPDTPLMLASLMLFWHLLNLRESETHSRRALKNWLWIGFWLGIAALSKYTAITLVLSLLLVMLMEKRFFWLKDKGLWLAVILTSLMITPVLYWNANHDWVSFLYQLNHGQHHDHWDWQRALNTQLAQLGVYSPLLYLAGLWLMLQAWRNPAPAADSIRLLAAFALPIIVLFALNSGYEMSLPHWTQLAWLLISPAVVYWVWQHWARRAVRTLVYISSALTLTVSLALNSLLALPWMPFPDNENPVRELHGWAQTVALAQSFQNDQQQPPLFAPNWTQASRIGWYAYPQPVYVTDNRFDQFDLWYGQPAPGSDGLLIVPSYEDIPPKTARPGHFQQCHLLAENPIREPNRFGENDITVVTYRIYHCQGLEAAQYQGWAAELPLVKRLESGHNVGLR